MMQYSYKDIQKIDKQGIVFKDEFCILFEECRREWSIEKKFNNEDSYCVAIRDSLKKPSYYLFYSKNRVKIIFDKKGMLNRKRNEKDFYELLITLKRYGFSSFDMT